jgi:hypothetical protein
VAVCGYYWLNGYDFLDKFGITDNNAPLPFTISGMFSVFYYFGMKGAIEDMKAEEEAKRTGGEPQYKTIGQIQICTNKA